MLTVSPCVCAEARPTGKCQKTYIIGNRGLGLLGFVWACLRFLALLGLAWFSLGLLGLGLAWGLLVIVWACLGLLWLLALAWLRLGLLGSA